MAFAFGPSNSPSRDMEDRFYISDWCIDPPDCVISSGEVLVKLEPKVMDLLVYMSRNPEHVHSREELLDNVWPGMVVSDEALTNAIIKLRKVFKDDAHHPKFIKTLPKRGYRLIAEVAAAEPLKTDTVKTPKTIVASSRLRRSSAVALVLIVIAAGVIWFTLALHEPVTVPVSVEPQNLALPDKPSIAVLPFLNIGNEAEHSYFSDGITDDLITDLSRISDLFVISRNSTFQYKGRAIDSRSVAGELGVHYILEGSVRRSGNKVRINCQLIDGGSGMQIWAERYDGNLDNVFELQDQVTRKIINALATKLTEPEEQFLASTETSSPQAYDEFLKGWERHWRFTRNDFAQAEVHFRKALQIDPDYTRANAALALIYWQTWLQKWHENAGGTVFAGWLRARKELKATESNPTPLVFRIKAEMQLHNRNYEKAITEAMKAIELNSNDPQGYLALAEVQNYMGSSAEARDNARKAMRLDPNFPAPYLTALGQSQFDKRNYEQAIETLDRAVRVNPKDRRSSILLISALGYQNLHQQAKSLIQRVNEKLKEENMRHLSVDWLKNRWPYQHAVDRAHFIAGLKKAGIPDW